MSDSCSNGMRSVGRRCMLLESLFNDVGCHVPMGRVSHSSQIHMLAHIRVLWMMRVMCNDALR
jgi:hypothetical protein